MIMAYKEMQCLEMWVKVKIEKPQNYPCLISHSFSVMMSFPMSLWLLCPEGGGGGVLICCLEGGARLKPPNPYPSLRVILAERVPIIRDFS